jgi:hypothetical protein
MINVKLTTVSGETKGMSFETKEDIQTFISAFAPMLPLGVAVHVDAPLAGIYGGWIHGTGTALQ